LMEKAKTETIRMAPIDSPQSCSGEAPKGPDKTLALGSAAAELENAAADCYGFGSDVHADDDGPSTPPGQYSKVLGSELTIVIPWTEYIAPITLNITGIEHVAAGSWSTPATYPRVFLTTTTSGLNCSTSNITAPGGNTVTSLGQTNSNNATISTSAAPGTWYVYGVDPRTSGSGRWSPTCRLAGTVNLTSAMSSLSINYDTGSPRTEP